MTPRLKSVGQYGQRLNQHKNGFRVDNLEMLPRLLMVEIHTSNLSDWLGVAGEPSFGSYRAAGCPMLYSERKFRLVVSKPDRLSRKPDRLSRKPDRLSRKLDPEVRWSIGSITSPFEAFVASKGVWAFASPESRSMDALMIFEINQMNLSRLLGTKYQILLQKTILPSNWLKNIWISSKIFRVCLGRSIPRNRVSEHP